MARGEAQLSPVLTGVPPRPPVLHSFPWRGRMSDAERIPPGQSRTRKWPILDANGPPAIDKERWRFRIRGLVGKKSSGIGRTL